MVRNLIRRQQKVIFHLYADDSQIGCVFDSKSQGNLLITQAKQEACNGEMKVWLVANFLKMNDHKTEFMSVTQRHLNHCIRVTSLAVGNGQVKPINAVRDHGAAGAHLDATMSLDVHITNIGRSAKFLLNRISRIRKNRSRQDTEHYSYFLVIQIGSFKLAAVWFTLFQTTRSQRVQNSAPRLVTGFSGCEHATPTLP